MYYSSLNKLYLEHIYKSSEYILFYYCAEINFALKRMYPKNMFYEVDQELGVGNCLLLHLCLGSGIVHQEQKLQIGGRGGLGMVTGQIEPCISCFRSL